MKELRFNMTHQILIRKNQGNFKRYQALLKLWRLQTGEEFDAYDYKKKAGRYNPEISNILSFEN